jgi:hypothetical protein
VGVLLARGDYNKENLERLFRFYSQEYPSDDHVLEVHVYTDPDNVKRELVDRHRPGYMSVTAKFTADTEPRKSVPRFYYDAFFQRIGNSPLVGGKNELYIYCPDLDMRERTEKITLRGNNPFDVVR